VDQVKLSSETVIAPKIGMVLSHGDEKYYASVAKEIQRRLRASPAESKKLYILLDSLGATERAMIDRQLILKPSSHIEAAGPPNKIPPL